MVTQIGYNGKRHITIRVCNMACLNLYFVGIPHARNTVEILK